MNLVTIIYWINVFFFFYMFMYALVFFATTIFSAFNLDDFFKRKKHMSQTVINNRVNYIPISILVPAYNEEVTIVDSIHSLLNLDYPAYEIIIVNDGSKDKTVEKVIEAFHLKKVSKPYRKLVESKKSLGIYEGSGKVKIILVDKENGGKSDALNMGINISSYPTFLCVDADSMLQVDALQRIIEPFLEDDTMVAVGGNIKISNHVVMEDGKVQSVETPKKPLVIFQMIEYLRVFLNSRISLNGINGNLIISGAFGLYNKKAIINVGGYTNGLMGEDMEIIMKVHSFYRKNKLPYKTSYVPDAICWTQVPEDISTLKRQRRRWHVGLGQSLKMHKYMFLNPNYGLVGLIAFPYFLFFEYITPFLEVIGIVTISLSYLLGIINLNFFLFYLLVYMGYNIIVSMISIIIERYMFSSTTNTTLTLKLILFSILEAFGYRQMISLFRIGNVFKRKKSHQWGEMVRKERKKEPVDSSI
ncbi:glycosyltransferase family 2 protein [Jeotgalibaca sp. MA1X17-3]|uniref:glycosyltransferase family 2 protein n=1 Tax=Jeotgalibaca sp. MA1X17-3 TaxID=2908211 RepID=UPI001F3CA145|nr:glycosyltransferase family 2 protein [Jeotgalibaca sp. MA1X17-3]UJF15410.1 glycosyltransferase family 2 protein [Jeotgalibaca sp. MA1X17-3]